MPRLNQLRVGRELVTSLSREVYNSTSKLKNESSAINQSTMNTLTVSQPQPIIKYTLDKLPLPVMAVTADKQIAYKNTAFDAYFAVTELDNTKTHMNDLCKLRFSDDDTFDNWLASVKERTVSATRSWNRVHLEVKDTSKYADITVYFESQVSSGIETIFVFYDQTDSYKKDSQEVSFAAMAVHELRTPLTTMKGYIEVFEDEVGPALAPEYKDILHKFKASAGQLTTFVGNILNIAKIEEGQFALTMHEESWQEVLTQSLADIELRARVHGKTIELHIAEGLPKVGIDRSTMQEVVNNLVDNAIKYSKEGGKIIIDSHLTNEGLVETTVQDFGIGIPEAAMEELFQKFHRSYKSRVQVGGTGLGLYLCKAILDAHGGNIWVRSKEGEGSIFGFSLLPYEKIAVEGVVQDSAIKRNAHGWIKNHSMVRK
jgi:signal transduction histidine kinase